MSNSVALYMRVSKEEMAINESNSITNQRFLLKDFVSKTTNLSQLEVKEFFDDGVTGVNFDRPDFDRLLSDLKSDKVDCIVVKDFSRFGRDYIETGEYIEEILPFMGVRFIAINEPFDSLTDNFGIEHQFKTLTNNSYIVDLSNNIKRTFKTKMQNGTFIPSQTVFGYKKAVENGKRKVVIDEANASVVRRIFEMATEYNTLIEIAKTLNREGIPTPLIRKKERVCYEKRKDNFWREGSVFRILHDERYTGKGIYKKRERVAIATDKTRIVPKEDWIIAPNNHPVIISEDIYNKALNCFKYPIKEQQNERSLYEKVKCHCCDYSMKRTSAVKTRFYCKTPKYINSPDCVSAGIFEADIENAIIKAVQVQIDVVREREKEKALLKKRLKSQKIDFAQKIKNLQKSVSNLESAKLRTYELYKDGKLNAEQFKNKKAETNAQLQSFVNQISDYKVVLENDKGVEERNYNPLYQFICGDEKLKRLSRQLADELIDKIVVFDSSHFEIVWKFKDFCKM